LEYGLEEVQEPGREGSKTKTYLVTYWVDDIIDRTLLDTKVENPITQVVAKGKKIVWKKLSTPEYGGIKYWYKMRVWATKYDSTCEGCNNTTALGAPVQQGVCAVDPTVIDMYTHFYVPGYGKCQALDVGGAIKGNKIDLAYKDHRTAPWRTGYVDIYLMDNAPQ
jgi:3D (Asp-Asp-Asp) domain-containing protein